MNLYIYFVTNIYIFHPLIVFISKVSNGYYHFKTVAFHLTHLKSVMCGHAYDHFMIIL